MRIPYWHSQTHSPQFFVKYHDQHLCKRVLFFLSIVVLFCYKNFSNFQHAEMNMRVFTKILYSWWSRQLQCLPHATKIWKWKDKTAVQWLPNDITICCIWHFFAHGAHILPRFKYLISSNMNDQDWRLIF